MARKKTLRKVSKTLLLVGEGYAEKAFLSHLHSIYSNGTFKITIKTACGKGPEHVINHAIRCLSNTKYDYILVLLDTDLAWPQETVRNALTKGINLIGANPCLEGLLLRLLNQRCPNTNKECKEKLHPKLSGPCTERDSYTTLFTEECIGQANNMKINTIISLLKGIPKKSVNLK